MDLEKIITAVIICSIVMIYAIITFLYVFVVVTNWTQLSTCKKLGPKGKKLSFPTTLLFLIFYICVPFFIHLYKKKTDASHALKGNDVMIFYASFISFFCLRYLWLTEKMSENKCTNGVSLYQIFYVFEMMFLLPSLALMLRAIYKCIMDDDSAENQDE